MSDFLLSVLIGFWVFHGVVNAGYAAAFTLSMKPPAPSGFVVLCPLIALALGPLVWPLLVGAKVGYAVAEKAQEKRDA